MRNMKKAIILFFLSSLLFSCKEHITVTTGAKADIEDSCFYNAKVEASNRKEFDNAYPDALSGVFIEANYQPDTILKEPIEISTKSERLIFKSINPYVQRDYYDEDEVTYLNLGFSSAINRHLLYANYWEYEAYFLIDNNTANIDTINGRPNFSPDKKKLVTFYVNPYEEGVLLTADFEIYTQCDNKLKIIFREKYNYIPVDIRWKGNDTICFKALSPEDYYNYFSRKPHFKSTYYYRRIVLNRN